MFTLFLHSFCRVRDTNKQAQRQLAWSRLFEFLRKAVAMGDRARRKDNDVGPVGRPTA